jgi:hypothetical protein
MQNEWLNEEEDGAEEEDGIFRIGEYDSDGNSTGACPHCGVSPVYTEGLGGGTCGHYLAVYDDWGGQSDWSELPVLPRLDAKWQATCDALFPVNENANGFLPHPELEKWFGRAAPLLNAWAIEGLCRVPSWGEEATRELLLSKAHGVKGIGYNTGVVFYELGDGEPLRSVVARLTEHFNALSENLTACVHDATGKP